LLRFERQCWDSGLRLVAGVDEAGRGPLAGPVVAAAVVFDSSFALRECDGLLRGLTDSKKLSHTRREEFFAILLRDPHVQLASGAAAVDEIEALNILNATHLAMARAVAALPCIPDHLLIDGLPVKGLPHAMTPIVGGDSKSLSIAAASVVAKVTRDREMVRYDKMYPEYGFAKHKGYGTQAHIQALLEHGPSPIHRLTFRPVREAAEILRRTS